MAELSVLQGEFDAFRRETQDDLKAMAADVKASSRNNSAAAQRSAVLEEDLASVRAELHAQIHQIAELSSDLQDVRDKMAEVRGQARGGITREKQHEKDDHKEKEELWRELSDLRADMSEAKKTLNILSRSVKEVGSHPPQTHLAVVADRGGSKERGVRGSDGRGDDVLDGPHHRGLRDMRLVPLDEEEAGSFELRRRAAAEVEAAAEWEDMSKQEQEQMLLVMLSYVHTMLSVSPLELLVNILHEKDLGFILLNARAGLISRWLGSVLAIVLVSGLPLLYGNYVAPVDCKDMCGLYHRPCTLAPHFDTCVLEALAQSPLGLLLGPAAVALIFIIVAAVSVAFWVLDTCASLCCCGCCRDIFVEARVSGRGMLYKLFFYWLRDRMPCVEFGGPVEFVVVCLSYPAFVFSLALLSLLRGHVAVGVPVAYMMGEAYCMALNWLFAPPDFARSVVGAELPRCFPQNFWSRLRENKSESFSINAAEAQEFRELIWAWWLNQDLQRMPCTPRHIRKLYVPDLKRSVVWDGAEHGPSSSAAQAQHLGLGFGFGGGPGSGRRKGYSGLRSADEEDRGRRPLHSPSSNFRDSACVGIYGNIAGMQPNDRSTGSKDRDRERDSDRDRDRDRERGGHHGDRDRGYRDSMFTHDPRDRDSYLENDNGRDHVGASSSGGGGGGIPGSAEPRRQTGSGKPPMGRFPGGGRGRQPSSSVSVDRHRHADASDGRGWL